MWKARTRTSSTTSAAPPPRFSFESSSPLAVAPVRFRFSGGAAALFLAQDLFVECRSRAVDAADAEMLLAVTPPKEPSDISEQVESCIAALEAPKAPPTDAPDPDGGRLLLQDDGLYEPDWVTQYLRIARGTLDNWVSQEKITHTHVGGKLRFTGKALREWLDSRTDRPDGEDDKEDDGDVSIDKFPWDGEP